ncbi:MAG: SEC-C metal-binding domain-containing protein, partial [Actinomycetota bacterium]
MAGLGRNDRCPCGSGRKSKRCCGVPRGPSEVELAGAFLAAAARGAAPALVGLREEDLAELWEPLFDLPSQHLSLLVALPELLSPELDRLHRAVAADDPEEAKAALPPVLSRYDTPPVRARIARAVIALRECGDIDRELAAAALVDLAGPAGAVLQASVL